MRSRARPSPPTGPDAVAAHTLRRGDTEGIQLYSVGRRRDNLMIFRLALLLRSGFIICYKVIVIYMRKIYIFIIRAWYLTEYWRYARVFILFIHLYVTLAFDFCYYMGFFSQFGRHYFPDFAQTSSVILL